MVYLLPFVSYLAGSKSVQSIRPSDPDTMTNTSHEAIAASSGKITILFWNILIKFSDFLSDAKKTPNILCKHR